MIVALTMLVFLTAEKNNAMSAPSAMPPNAVALHAVEVEGRPAEPHPDDQREAEHPEAVGPDREAAHLDALGEHGAGRPRAHGDRGTDETGRELSRFGAADGGLRAGRGHRAAR